MMHQELSEYIENELALGTTKETIHKNLINAKWPEQDIQDTFLALSNQVPDTNQNGLLKVALVTLIVLSLIGVGGYFYLQTTSSTLEKGTSSITTPLNDEKPEIVFDEQEETSVVERDTFDEVKMTEQPDATEPQDIQLSQPDVQDADTKTKEIVLNELVWIPYEIPNTGLKFSYPKYWVIDKSGISVGLQFIYSRPLHPFAIEINGDTGKPVPGTSEVLIQNLEDYWDEIKNDSTVTSKDLYADAVVLIILTPYETVEDAIEGLRLKDLSSLSTITLDNRAWTSGQHVSEGTEKRFLITEVDELIVYLEVPDLPDEIVVMEKMAESMTGQGTFGN
jgi:hypothetical protein